MLLPASIYYALPCHFLFSFHFLFFTFPYPLSCHILFIIFASFAFYFLLSTFLFHRFLLSPLGLLFRNFFLLSVSIPCCSYLACCTFLCLLLLLLLCPCSSFLICLIPDLLFFPFLLALMFRLRFGPFSSYFFLFPATLPCLFFYPFFVSFHLFSYCALFSLSLLSFLFLILLRMSCSLPFSSCFSYILRRFFFTSYWLFLCF